MKKRYLALILALALGGCALLTNAYNVVTGATISPTAVIVAANGFDAAEATATNYLRLPKCVNGGPLVCRSPAATARIIPAVRSGRIARNTAENLLRTNPGALGASGVYAVLQQSTKALQDVFNQYGIN